MGKIWPKGSLELIIVKPPPPLSLFQSDRNCPNDSSKSTAEDFTFQLHWWLRSSVMFSGYYVRVCVVLDPSYKKVNVKCTLVQAFRLCTGRTAHRRSRGIAVLFLDHGTRRWWEVSSTPRPHFTPGKDPVPVVQEAGWAPGPVWTGAENLASTGIRSPDRPARSQSLYRLRYPAQPFL